MNVPPLTVILFLLVFTAQLSSLGFLMVVSFKEKGRGKASLKLILQQHKLPLNSGAGIILTL
jgi:hypothetical protein